MKLTPLDIRKQQFKKVMRGYDTVEVDTFMEMMANEFEDLVKTQKELRDRLLELETQLKDYRQIERTLQQTLLQAQETTGRTYETARHEAESILREAEAKAARMVAQAIEQLNKMNTEIVQLRGRKDSLLAKMRLILTSELELIKVMESGSLEPSEQAPAKESMELDAVLKNIDDDTAPRAN